MIFGKMKTFKRPIWFCSKHWLLCVIVSAKESCALLCTK